MKLDIVESASVILMQHTASCHSFVCNLNDGSDLNSITNHTAPDVPSAAASVLILWWLQALAGQMHSKASLKSLVFAT